MSKSRLNFGQKIAFYASLWGCRLIAVWPDFVLFGVFKWIFYVLIYRVARYRVKVVRDNLSKCFPEKSAEELRRIERDFYANFAEIIICSLFLRASSIFSSACLSSSIISLIITSVSFSTAVFILTNSFFVKSSNCS